MRTLFPKPIVPGACFAVVAPSSQVDSKLLKLGEKKLGRAGFTLHCDANVLKSHRFWAGGDASRSAQFIAAIRSNTNNALWCARGGYGVTRILSHLDRARLGPSLRAQRKLLLGFSDITALHLYLWKKSRLASLHAPLMATPSWLNLKSRAERELFALIAGTAPLGKKSHTASWPTKHLCTAKATEGILIGGNLSVVCSLLGTPWEPNLDQAILFLEDCNEAPYRLDRMLNQLHCAGLLRRVRAIVAGDLFHEVPQELQRKVSWKQVLKDWGSELKIPVLVGLPVGHGLRNEALPLGVKARITRTGKLELLQPLVLP